jgi:hypothetical protein
MSMDIAEINSSTMTGGPNGPDAAADSGVTSGGEEENLWF